MLVLARKTHPQRERPKLLADLSPEAAKLIEDITIDNKGASNP
jgi:hypothetical protein